MPLTAFLLLLYTCPSSGNDQLLGSHFTILMRLPDLLKDILKYLIFVLFIFVFFQSPGKSRTTLAIVNIRPDLIKLFMKLNPSALPNLCTNFTVYARSSVLLLLIFVLQVTSLKSQSIWNQQNFKLSKDTISLVSMSGATAVTFTDIPPAPYSSGLISFPSGFLFRYGLRSYDKFSVSAYGFIRLGADIADNLPEQQSGVIVPLSNNTTWFADYKLSGTAPNRKFIIQWSGVMQPSGEPTAFQLWLSERTGKIEFVYQSLRGYYGYSDFWKYKVFCKTAILQKEEIASLQIKPGNADPLVSYSGLLFNNDSIYAKTRYTFQPDTIKPVVPGSLTFQNIQAGCLDVQFTDNSQNESVFQLERSDSLSVYFLENKLYSGNPAGTGLRIYNQKKLQPFWNYGYRLYASNGFLNSDTIAASVQTIMPQINGIKQIPGDYPSITSLLQDAACKHLGTDLVIELKNNYSFSAETLPVTFDKSLQHRLLRSVVIRPAAGASINWASGGSRLLFYVDSVKHVFLDGRPGGTGTTRGLTLSLETIYKSAIQYTNKADSGGVRFCNIISAPLTIASNNFSVVLTGKDSNNTKVLGDVNYFTLDNNHFTSSGGATGSFVQISTADSNGCKSYRIINNEFSRFKRDAVYIENGNKQTLISGNKFFQPEPVSPYGFLPLYYSSCINLINTEDITISANDFGGGSPAWGQGSYTLDLQMGIAPHHFIHYQNTSKTKKGYILNNRFGNIHCSGNGQYNLIFGEKGDLSISGNQFGSTDSLVSLSGKEAFHLIYLNGGTRTITNNIFSGIKGQYPDENPFYLSEIITSFMSDSVAITGNDFGGTNIPGAISSQGSVRCISTSSDSCVLVKNNEFRGISSVQKAVSIFDAGPGVTSLTEQVTADSNRLHHLYAGTFLTGIDLHLNSTRKNRITNNVIYALETKGLPNTGNPTGYISGIRAEVYDYHFTNSVSGEIEISGNRLHSFKPVYTGNSSVLTLYGIDAAAYLVNIRNNDIRLGKDVTGQNIDTFHTGLIKGIHAGGTKVRVDHNSIFIGGRGIGSTGIIAGALQNEPGTPLQAFVLNNIIQIDRENISATDPHIFQSVNNATTISARNIWYSQSDPTVSAALQAFKQDCNCDYSSFVGDPKFINPGGDSSTYSLGLLTGSAADSAGIPTISAVSRDIDGNLRDNYSPVDIGSHASTPCVTTTNPQISISSPVADTVRICSGGSVTINATITGGAFQQLQWQKNLENISGATTTSITVSAAGLYRLTGKYPCGYVSSRAIYVAFGPADPQPIVSINASVTSICSGSPVTFTSSVIYPGIYPSYQWQVNGANTGTNSPSFTSSTLANNSQVILKVTNTISCGANPTGTSNTSVINVNPVLTAIILITGSNQVNAGQSVSVNAFINTGGTDPRHQWQDSTSTHDWQDITGQTSVAINYNPAHSGDKIRCRLTSNATCVQNPVSYSNTIQFTVNVVTAVNTVPRSVYGILYYPNPVTNQVTIDSLRLSDHWEILDVIGADGSKFFTSETLAGLTRYTIDLSRAKPGLYLVRLYNRARKQVILKLIKI
jgi:hypothetical protein